MVAEDLLQDSQVRGWLEGVEPAWSLLTFESLRALRHEPSAVQAAIRIANDLSVGETAASPLARNTLILLRRAIERGGLPLTATGNLSRDGQTTIKLTRRGFYAALTRRRVRALLHLLRAFSPGIDRGHHWE